MGPRRCYSWATTTRDHELRASGASVLAKGLPVGGHGGRSKESDRAGLDEADGPTDPLKRYVLVSLMWASWLRGPLVGITSAAAVLIHWLGCR